MVHVPALAPLPPLRFRYGAGSAAAIAVALVATAMVPGCFAVKLQLRPNGAAWDFPAQMLDASDFEGLMQSVSSSGLPGLEDVGQEFWLADDDGQRLQSWEQVLKLPDHRRTVFAVPNDRLFQWSARKPGERWKVPMEGREPVEIETVARTPGVFVLHNLFTQEESDFLIKRALEQTGENALAVSGTGFYTNAERLEAVTRTSSNAFDSDSPESQSIIERCFEALRIPYKYEMADGLQIVRYEKGQAYISHLDWFAEDEDDYVHNFDPRTPGGSNRYATVFLYLVTPPDGGFTVFPLATIDPGVKSSEFVSIGDDPERLQREVERAKSVFNNSDSWEVELTQSCYSTLAVRPVKLGAALFYHQDAMTGALLPEAEHGACPSFEGTKWGANLWIWNNDRHLTEDPDPDLVTANFHNTAKDALRLEYSMDDGESWKPFTTLEPGEMFSAETWPGHVWRFTRDDESLAVVREMDIVEGDSRPTFTSHSTEL